MRTTIILICLLFFVACGEKAVNQEFRTIHLNPDEAQTLLVSDFFDEYEVVSFKGVLYSEIKNLLKCNDRYIVHTYSLGGIGDALYAFDLKGDSLNAIGNKGRGPGEYLNFNEYLVNNDRTIQVLHFDCKYQKYSWDGELLCERPFTPKKELESTCIHITTDSILFFERLPLYNYGGFNKKWMENKKNILKKSNKLLLYSIKDSILSHSYFPLKECVDLYLSNFAYVQEDTFCYFHEYDNCIYHILKDTIQPRYYIDRGKYDTWTTIDDYFRTSKFLGIGQINFRETDKYIIGFYRYKLKQFYFIYDKTSQITYNYDLVDDDLLKTGLTNTDAIPSSYFLNWMIGYQTDNNYLHFSYSPRSFQYLVNRVMGTMSEEQWEIYKQKHPDLIKAYENLNEENSDPVVISYHFKDKNLKIK